MDNQLIYRLKEFYTLETFQVAFYKTQLASAGNEYYHQAFAKLVQTEQGHMDFFAEKLNQAQAEVPTFKGSLFKLAGDFVGESVESLGEPKTFHLGAALENKAIEKYRTFIEESKDKQYLSLRETLVQYLLDEEFHELWLRDYSNHQPL